MQLYGVPRALDPEVVGSERRSADWMHCPVVSSTSRHATTLDEELVVRQRMSDVVMPAGLVVGVGVVVAVLLDVAADIGQCQARVGCRQYGADDERYQSVLRPTRVTAPRVGGLGRRRTAARVYHGAWLPRRRNVDCRVLNTSSHLTPSLAIAEAGIIS